ncbi:hypothetical protein PGTUg99_008774 [Puccinia graminis f. sp. tritici]|uniref:cellulose 1,4-beta-cellobiosidase (non-reducing end) n=1 Tax=Puccinia graminis f. sp. tritici TaxID=56615 RepID=A0A5B0RCG2_PUCGR|nr:hypothetical protein PGTUg99_008774 [Puccinia graminis f. sp. tritici]
MEQDGGKSKHPSNAAGAKYGTGYCDAKCPKDIKWVEGQANIKGWKADGEGKKLDTSKKFTVITQFITQGNTNKGELIEVRRMYLRQDGTLIQNEPVKVQGLDKKADSLTDKFCQANKDITKDQNSFKEHGGMKAMGQAMKNGMVLS